MPDEQGIRDWMNVTSVGLSQARDGAGIRMYYVIEDLDATYQATFATKAAARVYYAGEEHEDLNDSGTGLNAAFSHINFVDSYSIGGSVNAGYTSTPETNAGFGVDAYFDVVNPYRQWGPPEPYILHEMTHILIGPNHQTDQNGNGIQADEQDKILMMFDYTYGLAGQATTTTAAITAADLTIPVVDASLFSHVGWAQISSAAGTEHIRYSSKTKTSLTAYDRGFHTSTALAHPAGATVTPLHSGEDYKQIQYGIATMNDIQIR